MISERAVFGPTMGLTSRVFDTQRPAAESGPYRAWLGNFGGHMLPDFGSFVRRRAGPPYLREQCFDHISADVRQPEFAALEMVGQSFVVQTKRV